MGLPAPPVPFVVPPDPVPPAPPVLLFVPPPPPVAEIAYGCPGANEEVPPLPPVAPAGQPG